MLTLKTLALTNFGPFKGTQILSFPTEPGVTIVFGENGRGKTTLLNAFRFALFGTIKARAAQDITLLDVINIEARQDGVFSASVVLTFSYYASMYELTRKIEPRNGIRQPESEADLVIDSWLRRDDDVLEGNFAKEELARIMPEKVSRFFLFDGELLQEYEELLRQESKTGDEIKEAIEQILGVPVLTNARQDLEALHSQARKQESRAQTKDVKTNELQSHLAEALARKEQTESIVREKKLERHALESARAAIVQEMRKWERLRSQLDQRDGLLRDINDLKLKIDERKERLRLELTGVWKSLLATDLSKRRLSLEEEFATLLSRQEGRRASDFLTKLLNSNLDSNRCDGCARYLDTDARQYIQAKLAELVKDAGIEVPGARLEELRSQIGTIDAVVSADRRGLILEIVSNIEEARVACSDKQGRVADLQEATRNVNEAEVQKLSGEERRHTQEITILDQAIQSEQNVLADTLSKMQKIEAELDRIGGSDLSKERVQREVCAKLHQLFEEGVALYRDNLRAKVESDATEIFRELTSDPDYTGLQINQNYGLTIVHRSGTLVKVRSAGNEHIVALSLMGALQKNAPLRGPIVMDSPFGRLDTTHKLNVVKALPRMADQVILLVYESEVEPQMARNLLTGKLRSEYRMKRLSSFHTTIEGGTGGIR